MGMLSLPWFLVFVDTYDHLEIFSTWILENQDIFSLVPRFK